MKIWDTANGKEHFDLCRAMPSVSGAWRSARTASASRLGFDQTVKIWDSATGKELFTLKGHAGGSVAWRSARTASVGLREPRWNGEDLGRATGKELFNSQGPRRFCLGASRSARTASAWPPRRGRFDPLCGRRQKSPRNPASSGHQTMVAKLVCANRSSGRLTMLLHSRVRP